LFAGNLLPNNAASLRPPQISSLKIGSNTTGESELAITLYIKHQTSNINHLFHPSDSLFGKSAQKAMSNGAKHWPYLKPQTSSIIEPIIG
jgi:hypothetical protein